MTVAVATSAVPGQQQPCWTSKRGNVSAASWRGVNLGGWLVLEEWMSPQLFEDLAPGAADERALLERGGEPARRAVERFRQEFITEDDFRWLREVGRVNAVRLPLGFWCLEQHAAGTSYLPTRAYVDRAFDWAERHGLGVVLDLHGAIGSQNGQHHSGSCGGIGWLDAGNKAKNLAVLAAWAHRWGRRKAFLGLGLGNEVAAPGEEPGSPSHSPWNPQRWLNRLFCAEACTTDKSAEEYWQRVVDFYADAALRCRPYMHPDAVVVIDVCWDTSRWDAEDLSAIEGPVLLDYHHYECMGDAEARHVEEHCRAEALEAALEDAPSLPMVIGEFSVALKPESRGYCGDDWQRQFFQRQTALASEHGAGWFFFSYKLAREGWAHWSYRECVERGWIPTVACRLKSAGAALADDGSSTADSKGDGGVAHDLSSVSDSDVPTPPRIQQRWLPGRH